MSAQDQEVNMTFGFELRGDRQVERGLDGMIEKMMRANSASEVAAAGLEKFGRVFEAGLPFGLAAAGAGMLIDKIVETGQKSDELFDKLTNLSTADVDNSSLRELTDNVSEAKKALDDATKSAGFFSDALGFLGIGHGDQTALAKYDLDVQMGGLASKNAGDIDFQTRQSRLEAYGNKDQARIEKIRHDDEEKIRDLTKSGLRTTYTPIYKMLPGGWESDQITGYQRHDRNVNQPQIDALRRSESSDIANVHLAAFLKGNEQDGKSAIEQHRKTTETQKKLLEEFVKGNDADARNRVERHAREADAKSEAADVSDRYRQQDTRLQRKVDLSARLSDVDESTPAGRLTANNLRMSSTKADLVGDKAAFGTASDAFTKYQGSFADGREETVEEVKHGAELERKMNEARSQMLEDMNELNGLTKDHNALVREANKKDSAVIASHGRAIGGGGGVYAHSLISGVHGHGPSPGSINTNPLKDFSDAIRTHTEAIVKATGGSLQTTGL